MLLALPAVALAAGDATPFQGDRLFGIPVEFVLFAVTLAGVAIFHHHTLPIAIGGAAVIALYKIVASPFTTGAGLYGFVVHVEDEWVILANLLLLLVGFALLAQFFQESRIPDLLPNYLPDDWKGGDRPAVRHLLLNLRIEDFQRRVVLPGTNVDQGFKRHLLRRRIPIRAPNIVLLTAIFEQGGLTVGVHGSSTRQDAPLNIDGQFDVGAQRLKHFTHLLRSGAYADDMNYDSSDLSL